VRSIAGRETWANWLTNPAFDPVSQTEEYNPCAVKIEKLRAQKKRRTTIRELIWGRGLSDSELLLFLQGKHLQRFKGPAG
jgi:hypothetical protein